MRDRNRGRIAVNRLCTGLMAAAFAAAAMLAWEPGRGSLSTLGLILASLGNLALIGISFGSEKLRLAGQKIGIYSRLLEAAFLAGVTLSPVGYIQRLWLLGIPLIIAEGLNHREWRRPVLAGSLIGIASIIGGWGPFVQWSALVTPPSLLISAMGIACVLSAYRDREEQLEGRDRRMSTLMDTAAAVAGHDVATTILRALQAAVRDLGATAGFVALVQEENPDELLVEAAYSPEGEFSFPKTLSVGSGLSGYVVKMGQPVSIHATGDETIECDGLELEAQAAVSVPLTTHGSNRPGQVLEEHAIGAMTLAFTGITEPIDREDLDMLQSLASLLAAAVSNQQMEEKLRTTFLQTLESLATALEARDEYTRGHSHRVCEVSMLIGKALGFGPDALEELRIGTTLHDIGKIGVPDAILNKPGKLTDEEFVVMKSHAAIGYEICRPLMLSEGVLMLIRNHHEKLDGRGYPDGLKGGELPLSLRIICVADAFDAMSSRRPYRGVMDIHDVLSELGRGAGVQFDPVVVETLKNLLHAGTLHPIYAKYWTPKQEAA